MAFDKKPTGSIGLYINDCYHHFNPQLTIASTTDLYSARINMQKFTISMLCLVVLIGLVLVHHGAEAKKKEKGKGSGYGGDYGSGGYGGGYGGDHKPHKKPHHKPHHKPIFKPLFKPHHKPHKPHHHSGGYSTY